jgi:hypothetical protein
MSCQCSWQKTLAGVQTSIYLVMAPQELLTMTSMYAMVFHTDGSLIDGCAGFAFHWTIEIGFGCKISSPAGIFSGELPALFVTSRKMIDFD